MTKKKSVPQIRFAGYSDEWVKFQFGDILDKYEDPVATPHDGYERLGVRSHVKGTFHSYVAPGSELETAQMHRVAADKLLFNITFAWEHAVAITDETDAGKLVSHRFPQFSFAPEMDPKFFRYVVADDKFRYYLWLSSPGGAGRNRVLNIPEMLEYQTYLPQKAEQIRLADWFSNLDVMIVQHQSKLKKLQNLKASMLEKMFPKDGADMPEVRFKGFYGLWEKMSASELFTSYVDKGHPELPVLSATQDAGMVIRNEIGKSVFHETANEVGYKRVLPGQFVIHLRSFQGGFAHSTLEGITSPAYTVFGFKEPENHDDYFWKYVFMSKQFIKRLETVTYGIRDGRSISYEEFLTLDFLFPSKKEQTRISTYLFQLDSLIAIRKQEMEKLQNIKKSSD